MDLIKALNYQFDGRAVATLPPKPVCKMEKVTPVMVGCMKGFVHEVKVNPNVPPVQQKLRQLPLCVRDELSS